MKTLSQGAIKPIVICFIVLVFGVLFGFILENQLTAARIENADKLVAGINSNVVAPINAFGEIKSIKGMTIVLGYAGDEIEVRLKTNTKLVSGKTGLPMNDKKLTDLKVGDSISVILGIASDGALEAKQISLISQ